MKVDGKALAYGVLAGLGILLFYIFVLIMFESYGFALSEFSRLWVWLIPLAMGFGAQIGLYTSIKHDTTVNSGVAASGTISGGSMIACCSHYLLSVIPLIGIAGLSAFTSFLMIYQKAFFSIGIASSVVGIALMLSHKRKMKSSVYLLQEHLKINEEKDSIQINGKAIAVIIILLLLLVGTFGMFALSKKTTNTQTGRGYSNLPEKCRSPAGTDIESWKEHLGHHAETKDCLSYFK